MKAAKAQYRGIGKTEGKCYRKKSASSNQQLCVTKNEIFK